MTIIALDRIDPNPNDVRRVAPVPDADGLLTGSILELGVLTPVLLAEQPDGRFVILDGHRRVRCARAAGLDEVPAAVCTADPAHAAAYAAAANLVHAKLHPVDQWRAVQRLIDLGYSQDGAAQALGLEPRVARQMALLGGLPDAMLEAMAREGVPRHQELRMIASAPPAVQLAAFRKRRVGGQWWDVATACNRTAIPRSLARFDVATAGVVFEEDLFAQPGEADQFVTRDVAGFLDAQREWLAEIVDRGRAAGRNIAFAEDDGTAPKGWSVEYFDGKVVLEILAGAGFPANDHRTLFVHASSDGYHVGRIALMVGAKRAAAAAAARGSSPGPKAPRPAFSRAGYELLVQARNHALARRLTTPESRPPAQDLLRCMVLALDAGNVSVHGNPAAEHAGRYADLVRRLMDGAQPRPLPAGQVEAIAAEALARTVRIGPSGQFGGDGTLAALTIGRLLGADADLERFDTAEALATVNGDELRRLAVGVGIKAPSTVGELRRRLVGNLPDWQPATFAAPEIEQQDMDGDDEAEDEPAPVLEAAE